MTCTTSNFFLIGSTSTYKLQFSRFMEGNNRNVKDGELMLYLFYIPGPSVHEVQWAVLSGGPSS